MDTAASVSALNQLMPGSKTLAAGHKVKRVFRFALRQWVGMATLLFFWAAVQGTHVVWCLAHGSGLYGYRMGPGTGDGSEGAIVSVWPLFIQATVFAGLGGLFLVFGFWHRRGGRGA